MSDIDPNSQGQATATDNAAGAAAESRGNGVSEGIQKRIDELTFKVRESERQNTELNNSLSTALAMLAESNAAMQRGAQEAAAAPAGVDPEISKAVKAVLGPELAAIRASQQQLAAMMEQKELNQVLARVKDPEVLARKNQILAEARRNGQQMPERAALVFAAGEKLLFGPAPTSATDIRRTYNENADGVQSGQSAAPQRVVDSVNQALPIPDEVRKLPPDKQIEYQLAVLEKRLNGKAIL